MTTHVTPAWVSGRARAEYVLPPEGESLRTEYLRDDEWELQESILHYRHKDGEYYLHVGVAKRRLSSQRPGRDSPRHEDHVVTSTRCILVWQLPQPQGHLHRLEDDISSPPPLSDAISYGGRPYRSRAERSPSQAARV